MENLCHTLFNEIAQMELRLAQLEVQETDTSVISSTRADWVADPRFSGETSHTDTECALSR